MTNSKALVFALVFLIAGSIVLTALPRNKTPKVRLTVDSTVFKFLAKEGCKSNLGARPLRRLVADKIANPLARIILQTEAKELNLRATVSNNKVKIKN